MIDIRLTHTADIPDLQDVLRATGLFPPEYLPGMLAGQVSGTERETVWLTGLVRGRAIGFCMAAPETLTDGTWNMLALAVHPDVQGRGLGGAIVARLEAVLRDRGGRLLIADTSGSDGFAATRAFYRRQGYEEEARIRDFWAAGDDKVVFRKALTPVTPQAE